MQDSQAEIRHNLALAFHNLTKEISGVRANKDIEFLHRMRVASRRLSNILWSYRYFFDQEKIKSMRREVKKITRLLGRARDLDTQAVFVRKAAGGVKGEELAAGFKALREVITENRAHAQAEVLNALRLVRSLTPEGLTVCSDVDVFSAARKNINRRIKQFLKLSKAAHRKKAEKALHKMRIGAKHLRYTLENFSFLDQKKISPFIEEARFIQQVLGDMHNYLVWRKEALLEAKKCPHAKKSAIYFADLCRTLSRQSYQEFLKVYHRQRKEGVWGRITEIVDGLN
jgi:CHAD domain-containing protein